MTRARINILLTIVATIIAMMPSSCIRVDYEDCPPLSVDIVVKDKNYYNVDKVDLEDAVAENLPFNSYVPNLTYTLMDMSTGKTVAQRSMFITTSTKTIEHVDFPSDLPFGTYILTVWGGIAVGEPLPAAADNLPLHPAGITGGDPYLTCDTLVYDYDNAHHTVEMERVKGKLIIETEHLPLVATQATHTITHLRNNVSTAFKYTGDITLTRDVDWSGTSDYKVWKQVLAPSTGEKLSLLDLDFKDVNGNLLTPILPKDVNITINRNALTVLRYIWAWNPGTDTYDCTIMILIDDNWEVYHAMIVD